MRLRLWIYNRVREILTVFVSIKSIAIIGKVNLAQIIDSVAFLVNYVSDRLSSSHIFLVNSTILILKRHHTINSIKF